MAEEKAALAAYEVDRKKKAVDKADAMKKAAARKKADEEKAATAASKQKAADTVDPERC